ncbi:hypothetical protein EJ06DRAFT_204198 [Trichodelitschia bisporula]|uniref:G-protein coupled receptors family 1 profile domain-containing protein n=1 Tax=Trichodelitschia bisporula TaxID=703511 RepID=A0A6G1I7Y9_9PEZI|nr:hypothetical protein EJ06DRAFT_204198 [Trichodelitschia bisporula]
MAPLSSGLLEFRKEQHQVGPNSRCPRIALLRRVVLKMDAGPDTQSTESGDSHESNTQERAGPRGGNPSMAAIVYTIVSISGLLIVALLLGSRAKHLRFNHLLAMNTIRKLVVLLYVSSIGFIVSTVVMGNAVGITSLRTCKAGIYLCLGFYMAHKSIMYFFLTERAHSIRAPYQKRLHDRVWCFFASIMTVGFTVLAVMVFIHPLATYDKEHGCAVGLPIQSTLALLGFDLTINFALTGVFVWLLQPMLAFNRPMGVAPGRRRVAAVWGRIIRSPKPLAISAVIVPSRQSNTHASQAVERLVWKTMLATILVILPTITNLGVLVGFGDREKGWFCYTMCIIDGMFHRLSCSRRYYLSLS